MFQRRDLTTFYKALSHYNIIKMVITLAVAILLYKMRKRFALKGYSLKSQKFLTFKPHRQ